MAPTIEQAASALNHVLAAGENLSYWRTFTPAGLTRNATHWGLVYEQAKSIGWKNGEAKGNGNDQHADQLCRAREPAEQQRIEQERKAREEADAKAASEAAALRARAEAPAAPIDTSAPLQVARAYLESRVTDDGPHDVVYWQGEFWQAISGTHYERMPTDALKASLYPWLENQITANREQIKPHRRMVEGLVDALKAAAHLDGVKDAPAWIAGGDSRPPAHELIACRNGLLHVPSRQLLAPDRWLFNLNALDFDYNENAPAPSTWISFLESLWGNDWESIETLQEMFGLALTSDTQHQKAFLIVGPRRAGKGTISEVLHALVGSNYTAPTLASIGREFGMQSLIGKTLAVISDARIGGKADLAAIAENLLRITGEDTVSVPRKFLSDWTARLRVRFVILSNELPALVDQSAALSGRFIILRLTKSFYGQEDQTLRARIIAEMPGIILWALSGLDRLRARGHLVQPKSAQEMVEQLETLASPIKCFITDKCVMVPGASIECGRLFTAWVDWAREQGRDHPGTSPLFGRNLSSAFPQIRTTQPRINGKRERHYEGLRLRDITDPDPE